MDNRRFRLKEAIANAADNGIKVSRLELAKKLWPGRTEDTLRSNLSNLENGHTRRVEVEWIWTLTEILGCTSDMLFGLEPFHNIKRTDSI